MCQTFLLNYVIATERILDFEFICGKIELCMNTLIYDFNRRNFLFLSDMFLGSAHSYYSQTSVFEHNPFQKAVRKAICSKSETIFPIKIKVNNFNPFQL